MWRRTTNGRRDGNDRLPLLQRLVVVQPLQMPTIPMMRWGEEALTTRIEETVNLQTMLHLLLRLSVRPDGK
jgi:hypothetical protein